MSDFSRFWPQNTQRATTPLDRFGASLNSRTPNYVPDNYTGRPWGASPLDASNGHPGTLESVTQVLENRIRAGRTGSPRQIVINEVTHRVVDYAAKRIPLWRNKLRLKVSVSVALHHHELVTSFQAGYIRWRRAVRGTEARGEWTVIAGSRVADPTGPLHVDQLLLHVPEGSTAALNAVVFYKGRPFYISQAPIITVSTYGRAVEPILEFINELVAMGLRDAHKCPTGTRTLTFVKSSPMGGWGETKTVIGRTRTSLVVSDDVDRRVFKRVEDFTESAQWYNERGIPYKLCLILEGEAGCGKSSIARVLATETGRNLRILNLASIQSDEMLESAFDTCSGDIVLIEDFDSASVTMARGVNRSAGQSRARATTRIDAEGKYSTEIVQDGVTLSGLLNVLDGAAGIHNTIVILTTNTIKDIDPAILRRGRVDDVITVGRLTHDDVVTYIGQRFPDAAISDMTRFAAIPGCDLQELYLNNRIDADAFIESIPRSNVQEIPFIKTGT